MAGFGFGAGTTTAGSGGGRAVSPLVIVTDEVFPLLIVTVPPVSLWEDHWNPAGAIGSESSDTVHTEPFGMLPMTYGTPAVTPTVPEGPPLVHV